MSGHNLAKRKKSAHGDRDWWKHVIIYQIYPRSFKDSISEGVGDIKGIISRLDHCVYLNIGAIWISPMYKSPMVDHGYDIDDFKDIDPVFGTMQDFELLVAEAHKRDIRVIMDFIANHSSDQHRWFVESCRGGEDNPYKDYYIWKDGKTNKKSGTVETPNNWLSAFGGSAWTWVEERQQFYLHMFVSQQPDLNHRNPKVLQEILDIFQFWLDKGVDGFRMDAISHIIKHDKFLDEPQNKTSNVLPDHPDYLDHIYTYNQPEVHDVMKKFRGLFDKYEDKTGKYIFMMSEVYSPIFTDIIKFYNSGSDMPLNLSLLSLKGDVTGFIIRDNIKTWMDAMPQEKWPNFVLGNHDCRRLTARMGLQCIDAMNIMLLLLPGTPTTYYGEEIGMMEIQVSYEDTQDPFAKNLGPERYETVNRDPCRAPMQWDDSINAGFSTALQTWLPVHPSYKCRNVKAQMSQGEISHIKLYRRAARLRKLEVFHSGVFEFLVITDNIFSFIRRRSINQNKDGAGADDDDEAYLVALNISRKISTDDYSTHEYDTAVVVIDTESTTKDNTQISLNNLTLRSGHALVMKIIFHS